MSSHADATMLSPVDAAWLAMDRPGHSATITALLRVEGLTPACFRRFLENHWLGRRRFREMPVRHGTTWRWERDPTFSLRHHAHIIMTPFSEDGLQEWVSARLNEPLPDYRPRWCFWLLPQAEGGAALVLRIHHCYADGLSLIQLFESLTTRLPDHPTPPPPLDQTDRAARHCLDAGWQWLQDRIELTETQRLQASHPNRAAAGQLAQTGLRLVNELSQYLLSPEDSDTALRPDLLGRRACRWSESISLERFRDLAEATGCTINDVLLSCVASAVRRHLVRHDGDVDLEEALLHAAVPVDIRGLLPEEARPGKGELGNLFGTVFVPLPVDADRPLERLYRIKHETRRLKHSWQPGISWGLMCSAGLLPKGWQQPLSDLFARKASAVVSNVAGTRETRYLAGCRVTDQMFWVPQAGDIGLGVSIVSYAGRVRFGVVADEAVLAEPTPFLNDCLAALNNRH